MHQHTVPAVPRALAAGGMLVWGAIVVESEYMLCLSYGETFVELKDLL